MRIDTVYLRIVSIKETSTTIKINTKNTNFYENLLQDIISL